MIRGDYAGIVARNKILSSIGTERRSIRRVHRHRDPQWYLCTDGEIEIDSGDETHRCGPGQFFSYRLGAIVVSAVLARMSM